MSRLRGRNLRKLSAELARLELASEAARAERKRLERACEAEAKAAAASRSRTEQTLSAARRGDDQRPRSGEVAR